MPLQYRAPRGTRDLLPEDRPCWDRVETVARSLTHRYGFRKIDTPSFEETGLFIRSVGEGTDIVDKEMYTFDDKGGNSLTLRPEGTAPVMRAYLENGMHVLPQPVKLFYLTSIFRYDRPQAGRYREHRQFGVEAIGETDPSLDAEIITLAASFYAELGLSGVSLQLNSIGCPACRPAYLEKLVAYYRTCQDRLSDNDRRRLDVNPLRLLDSKEEGSRALVDGAPKITDDLCEECSAHFGALREYLDLIGLPFSLNPTLVRGLDYYTKTVFEFWVEGIGAQNAIGAGGRYDGLAESLGGARAPGIGFGIGLDRVILSMQEQRIEIPDNTRPRVFLVTLGDAARRKGLVLSRDLRSAGLSAVALYGSRSMRAQMRQANASGAAYTLILGENELENGIITCRDMASGEQREIPLDSIVDHLKSTA